MSERKRVESSNFENFENQKRARLAIRPLQTTLRAVPSVHTKFRLERSYIDPFSAESKFCVITRHDSS